jgi:hypothetical protein
MASNDPTAANEFPFRAGTLLPPVTLWEIETGGRTNIFHGRGPRVVVLLHGPDCDACRAYRRAVGSITPQIADWDGRIFCVQHDNGEIAAGRRGHDDEGTAVYRDLEGRLAPFAPALLVADEWGEVYEAFPAGAEHKWPSPDEVLEWVRFIAIQCPECEAPEGGWLEEVAWRATRRAGGEGCGG